MFSSIRILESCFGCDLADHKFDESSKMDKKIGIKIEKKNTDCNDAYGENERHGERSSSLNESKSWIEVNQRGGSCLRFKDWFLP